MKSLHVLILALSTAFLAACSFSLAEDITPPPGAEVQAGPQPQTVAQTGPVFPVVPPDPALGKPIYAEKCAPCHGDTGMGNGPRATQLTVPVAALGDPQVARQATPEEWFQMVTQGNLERFMPPFASLSERQRWDVVAYAFTLSETPETIATGVEVYKTNCARCHGANGQGDGSEAAGLATRPIDFSNQAVMVDQSAASVYQVVTDGKAPDMPAYGSQLSDTERWAVAAYLRNLSFARTGEVASTTETPAAVSGQVRATAPISNTQVTTGTVVGNVTVQVLNGSGGPIPASLPVTLYGFDNMQIVFSTTLTSEVNGLVNFPNIELPPGRAFLASADFNGVTYGSDVGVVDDPKTPPQLAVTLYETTTDTSVLTVDRLHLFFDFSQSGLVQVVEVFIISNPTDKAVTAVEPGGPVVTFNLPENATDLQFQDGALGDRYLKTPTGFADTLSVRPGSGHYQVLFAYYLPYERSLKFSQPVNLAVNSTTILVPEVGVKVKGDNLQDGGTRDVQGSQYLMFTGSSLNPGGQLNLELTGKPKLSAGLSAPETRNSMLIGIGALGMVLVVAGVWVYRRERAGRIDKEIDEVEDEIQEAESSDDPETLMDTIIALDDLYKAGELPEEAYQKRRAELKSRLQQLMSKDS